MSSISPETSLLPHTMSDFLQVKLCLLLMFNSDVLIKIPKETLGITGYNNSHWTDVEDNNNQSAWNPLCSAGYGRTLRVCSMPSSPQEFGNTRKSDRVLVFRFNNNDIKIFITEHHISLPNASITYKAERNIEMPMYNEEISKLLYAFYKGSLVFLDISLPFAAKWDGVHFGGRSFYTYLLFELHCASSLDSRFYKTDQCFICLASCTQYKTVKRNTRTLKDYQDLFDTHLDYIQLQHKAFIYSKKQPTQNRRRGHRSLISLSSEPHSCVLHLVADHLFYKYIGEGSVMKTVNIILGLVNEADAIFRSTDFDGDLQGDNIGFIIGKVTVFVNEHGIDYKLYQPYLTSEEYLRIFSRYDFSDFCLAVGFTFRDFHGTSGSSFPAYSDILTPGGLCQKRLEINSYFMSFNTLVVTFLNEGKRLKWHQVMLTLTHELGHSFGAGHDSSQECEREFGKFIMYEKSNLGTEPNNHRFSACSIQNMLPVILKKGGCLIQSDYSPHCGNSIPEHGEECDCGISEICLSVDPCCTPADVDIGRDRPCTLRRSAGKLCSPKVSPCCNDSCLYMPSGTNHVCNMLDSCLQLSRCNGQSSNCPVSDPLPNGTLCSQGLRVCNQGHCSVDICRSYYLDRCVCENETDRCKLCCKDSLKGTCKPANDYKILDNRTIIFQESGAPCANFGMCDSTHACLSIAALLKYEDEEPFLGFNSYSEFELYVKNNWFYAAFAALAFLFCILILAGSYKIDDTDYLKALRYGKMLAIFAIGEYQSKVYRKTMFDVDEYYSYSIYRVLNETEPQDYIEAVSRLKMFFPEVSTQYLSSIAKISASERIAIKILLLQGFRICTFTKKRVVGFDEDEDSVIERPSSIQSTPSKNSL